LGIALIRSHFPMFFLCVLVILGYIYNLSRTTFYFSGEDGVFHIIDIWYRGALLQTITFISLFWVARFIQIKLSGQIFNFTYNRIIFSVIVSLFFVVLLTITGPLILSFYYESPYLSEGVPEPDLHLSIKYYIYTPLYAFLVFIFYRVVNYLVFPVHRAGGPCPPENPV